MSYTCKSPCHYGALKISATAKEANAYELILKRASDPSFGNAASRFKNTHLSTTHLAALFAPKYWPCGNGVILEATRLPSGIVTSFSIWQPEIELRPLAADGLAVGKRTRRFEGHYLSVRRSTRAANLMAMSTSVAKSEFRRFETPPEFGRLVRTVF